MSFCFFLRSLLVPLDILLIPINILSVAIDFLLVPTDFLLVLMRFLLLPDDPFIDFLSRGRGNTNQESML